MLPPQRRGPVESCRQAQRRGGSRPCAPTNPPAHSANHAPKIPPGVCKHGEIPPDWSLQVRKHGAKNPPWLKNPAFNVSVPSRGAAGLKVSFHRPSRRSSPRYERASRYFRAFQSEWEHRERTGRIIPLARKHPGDGCGTPGEEDARGRQKSPSSLPLKHVFFFPLPFSILSSTAASK